MGERAGPSSQERLDRRPPLALPIAVLVVPLGAIFAWVLLRDRGGGVPGSADVLPARAPVHAEVASAPANAERRADDPTPGVATARRGRLLITSVPGDAQASVDGTRLGPTPQDIELDPGPHTVEVAKSGYKSRREIVRLEAGETERVSAVLEPLPATLHVVTRGAAGTISIDNEVVGTSASVSSQLPPGPHVVRVRHRRYRSVTKRIHLYPGETRTLEIELPRR